MIERHTDTPTVPLFPNLPPPLLLLPPPLSPSSFSTHQSDPDHDVSKAPTKVRAKASVPGSTSADAGALGGFIEAKTVYTSASLPLLAHVWPTITASPGRTSPVRSPRKVSPSKSAPGLSHPFVERKESLDPYAAGGTRFRASFSGNQVSVHSGGLNTDGLTPKMRNDFEKSRSAHKEQRKAKESKRKNAWNPTPHVVYGDRCVPEGVCLKCSVRA
jgi:hypothetical protein